MAAPISVNPEAPISWRPVSRQVNLACMSRINVVQVSIQMSEDNSESCDMMSIGLLRPILDRTRVDELPNA